MNYKVKNQIQNFKKLSAGKILTNYPHQTMLVWEFMGRPAMLRLSGRRRTKIPKMDYKNWGAYSPTISETVLIILTNIKISFINVFKLLRGDEI